MSNIIVKTKVCTWQEYLELTGFAMEEVMKDFGCCYAEYVHGVIYVQGIYAGRCFVPVKTGKHNARKQALELLLEPLK